MAQNDIEEDIRRLLDGIPEGRAVSADPWDIKVPEKYKGLAFGIFIFLVLAFTLPLACFLWVTVIRWVAN